MISPHVRTAIAAFLLTLCFFVAVRTSAAAIDRSIKVTNGTKATTIYSVHVTHAGDRDWGPELLEQTGGIAPGKSVLVDFYDDEEWCTYDVHVTFSDKRQQSQKIDVCGVSVYTITFRDQP